MGAPPRYAAIRREIEARILSGALAPGAKLPSEEELVAAHGVSRMTVGRALAELVAAGLVVRRRKAGSFVTVPRAGEGLFGVPDMRETLGPGHRHAVLSRRLRRATRADRARLGEMPGEARVLALTVSHEADGRAAALEDRLINLDAVPAAQSESFAASPPGSWLLAEIPWTEVEHRIRAVAADTETASGLGVAPGSPCLVLERRTWHGARPITAVRFTYPGDRHEFVGRARPGAAPRAP